MTLICQDGLHLPGKGKSVLQVVVLNCHDRNGLAAYL